MSDHPKEANRNLKRIFICDDIYLDVFRLLAPAKVGLELALVSDRFDALVDTHFKYRKWTFGKLEIWSKDIFKKNKDGPNKVLPFPPKPLPNSIVGFAHVNICIINSPDAIDFFQCIGRLLASDISLELYILGESNWNTFATSVWPLLNIPGIIKIYLGSPSDLHHFRRFISPSILRDCTNLRMISFENNISLQFPPDDIEGSSDGQMMCKWLHTPRADGQPKVLNLCRAYEFPMDALKMAFLNATSSVSFIIRFYPFSAVSPFELVNSLTREQLTSQRMGNADHFLWLIERSPIDKCAQKWAKWEKEALDDEKNDWKVIRIRVSIEIVGHYVTRRQRTICTRPDCRGARTKNRHK